MSLPTIAYNMGLYLLPTIIILGVIGNVLNIIIFARPTLRRTCSIFFLAGSFNGLLVLLFGALTRWLSASFSLDAVRTSLPYCRFRLYMIYVIYNLAPYFTACITVDRFCASSRNATIRRWSSYTHTAHCAVLIVILITSLAYIHITFRYTIINSVCQPERGFYAEFFPFFTTGYYFFAIVIIIIFGLGTSYNIRSQYKRVQTMTNTTRTVDRRRIRCDNQLLLMLLVQIICYAFLALPYHLTLIMASIKPAYLLNSIFLFTQNITVITLNLSQAINFYVFTLTAKLYRKELINIIRQLIH